MISLVIRIIATFLLLGESIGEFLIAKKWGFLNIASSKVIILAIIGEIIFKGIIIGAIWII